MAGTKASAGPLWYLMATTTLLRESLPGLADPAGAPAAAVAPASVRSSVRGREPLLREALGMSLRAFRADKGVSLRELAAHALVSPGDLSELGPGRKEGSSEVLASICDALETTVSEVVIEAVANLSLNSLTEELEATAPAAAEA